MRLVHAVSVWLCAVLTTVVLVALLWLIIQFIFQLRLLDVQTGSMVPTFRPADALIVKRSRTVPKVGQIVSYRSSRNPDELVTHRVIATKDDRFQTKGDAVNSLDPPVSTNLLEGRVVLVIPSLGHVLRWMRGLPGLVACVYVPALALVVRELIRLEHHYRRLEPYRLYGRQML